MRSMLVLLVLTSIACGRDHEPPDADAAEEAETTTGQLEGESSTPEDSTSESAGSETEETGEPVECPLLGEAECDATPGCHSISGTPIAADLTCTEEVRFAFCSSDEFCSDAETNYLDPDGGCWWFYADCIHSAAGWIAGSDECPHYEAFHMLPECG